MAIINKGILNSKIAYLRQLGNDWPTAQVVYTADVPESSGNLYFTNARVLAATSSLTTANISEASSNLYFTNARVLAATSSLTTANISEVSSNLYFTNARVVSALTAGQGITITSGGTISTRGDDTGLGMFNSGINLANAMILSNTYANLVTFSPGDGASFIVYSMHMTNFSANTAYVNARAVSGANTTVFANLFEIPGSSVAEFFLKPQLFKANDQIQMQSLDNTLQPANSLISALASYQGSADANFDRAFITLTDNNPANLFITPNKRSIIESLKVVNPNPVATPVTAYITDNSLNLFAYLAANVSIPAFSSLELCELPKAMPENYIIRVQKSGSVSNPISAFSSTKYTTQYTITPSSSTVSEGSSVSFSITTLNVGDGTTLYYTVRGTGTNAANVVQRDFSSPISGSVVISSSTGSVNLTLLGKPDITDIGETFVLELRKTSVTGSVLATSAEITIIDSANAITTSVVESSSSVVEGSNVTFTIRTYGVSDQTIYYSSNVPANPAHFTQSNTGSFALVNNVGNITLTTNVTLLTFGRTTLFTLDFRTGNVVGDIFATSNVVTIQDTAFGGAAATSVRMLMVAGGGGGGASQTPDFSPAFGGHGGGGGAGGLIENWSVPVSSNTYNITVGAGGTVNTAGTNTIVQYGATGQFFTLVGGGPGETGLKTSNQPGFPARPGSNGGSGGGGGGGNAVYNDGNGQFNAGTGYGYPSPTQQGYPGYGGWYNDGPAYTAAGGGGGGAGAQGGQGNAGPGPTGTQGAGGSGGDGKISSLVESANIYFAGGGGGGGYYVGGGPPYKASFAYGGLGGGGSGGDNSGPNAARAGGINTGGGGGAGAEAPPASSKAGGSGIVVMNFPNAYRLPTVTGNVSLITANSNIIVKFYDSGTIRF